MQVQFDPRAERIALKVAALIEAEAVEHSKDTGDTFYLTSYLTSEVYEMLHFSYLAAKHNKGDK